MILCPKDGCWPRSHLLRPVTLAHSWGIDPSSCFCLQLPGVPEPSLVALLSVPPPARPITHLWHSSGVSGTHPPKDRCVGLCPAVRSKDEPVPEHACSRLRCRQAVPEASLHSFKLQAMKKSPSPHWKLLRFAVSLLRHAFIVCQPAGVGAALARIGGRRRPVQRLFTKESS